ncbi:MAG: ATP-binding cassette domain-containing protein, partial [Eubacterium sp.]
MATLEISNLTFTYPEMENPAIKNINLDINDGDFVVLCGKSGCGKSTLLRHFKTVLTPHGTRTGT